MSKSYIWVAIAGWSSLVARRAHNPKAVGSNPTPATNEKEPNGSFFISAVFYSFYTIHLIFSSHLISGIPILILFLKELA